MPIPSGEAARASDISRIIWWILGVVMSAKGTGCAFCVSTGAGLVTIRFLADDLGMGLFHDAHECGDIFFHFIDILIGKWLPSGCGVHARIVAVSELIDLFPKIGSVH